jgi:hypothetical protein
MGDDGINTGKTVAVGTGICGDGAVFVIPGNACVCPLSIL